MDNQGYNRWNNSMQRGYPQDGGRQFGGGRAEYMSRPAQSGAINPNFNDIESFQNSINTQVNWDKVKQKVCVYWLKKVCRKGDTCEYLHRYIEDRIPICKFFQQNGHCHIMETQCVYRHPKQEDQGSSKK